MTLYLKNARYIDPVTHTITDTNIKVDPGLAGTIEFVADIPVDVQTLNCDGKLVTRAFANAHHHIYSCLARGMPMPATPPVNFVQILEKIWWKLDKALDLSMIRASATICALESARAGCTFIIDHHASPNAASDSLHTIADAFNEVGLSHLLCYELSDRDGPDRLDLALQETDNYLQHHQGLVGLHASFTASDALLEQAMDLARTHNTGIHIHVAEAQSDQDHCLEHYSKRCIQRLADAGALDLPQTILAHCIHLDHAERETIAGSCAWVTHQAQSNANNAVGTLNASVFSDRVLIGTDGMNSDCLAAMQAAYLMCQQTDAPSPVQIVARLRRVHQYLASSNFTGDGANNLVVLDYPTPTPVTSDNWPAHLVFGLTSAHIHTVISNGNIIINNHKSTMIDEQKACATAREQALRLWKQL